MPRQHFAIVANEAGIAERFPFKSWVRDHMDLFPPTLPMEGTTSQFRNAAVGLGWVKREGEETVYMIKPDANDSIAYAEPFINDLQVEEEEIANVTEEVQELTFGLERNLQNALRANISSLEPGLQLIDGGRERHTDAGRIDITARDVQGKTVVIELKAGTAKPEVIAQTLAYMETVRVEDNRDVRGIIVASDFVNRVQLAARQIPNLKLVRYAFQFNFNNVD